jgi:hypothetical protein
MSDSVNDEAVYRTAHATPGLLNMDLFWCTAEMIQLSL